MLKNYFITAINILIKNKLYSAINIIGLAVGLAACILITLYVRDELSFDKQWEKADRIYRVNNKVKIGPNPANIMPLTSMQALSSLKKFFPKDIEFGTRIQPIQDAEIHIGDVNYSDSISLVDKDFIKMFRVEEIKGNLESTLMGPGNIALSEELAKKYFGDKDPIGEMITIIQGRGNKEQFQVTAVYRLASPNTVLSLPAFSLLKDTNTGPVIGLVLQVETYIRLYDTADIDELNKRLPDFFDQAMSSSGIPLSPGQKLSDVRSYLLQKITDIYFNPVGQAGRQVKAGNRTVITVFIIISLLVLIIACINFIILTTAKAAQRAREVAMRKVVGARFKQLIFQFLGESLLVTFIAFILALLLVQLTLPVFESVMNKDLTIPYLLPIGYLFVILLLLFVGLTGGFYPGIVLSRFSPTRALKANQSTEAYGSIMLRKILVIFQFTASIVLIIATLVAYCQLLYTGKHNPGYNPENLLVVENIGRQDISPYKNTLQQELLKLPEISNVALSNLQPEMVGMGMQMKLVFQRKGSNNPSDQGIPYNCMLVDYNFFKTYEMPLLSGRYFNQDLDQKEPPLPIFGRAPDTAGIKERRIVLNRAAARQFGFGSAEEAVGEILLVGNQELSIIGVVEDSQFRSIRMEPEPEIYRLIPDTTMFMTVRYKGEYKTVVNKVEQVWHKVVGSAFFRDSNVEQNLVSTFAREKQENKALIAFAMLSVFIACMGLFGMASFTTDRRIKEIGMRKVLGAKVINIVNLLTWQFLKPVIIANVIAWPVAIYAMQNWLQRFPYRFDSLLMIPVCLVSGLIALIIAWFTVAGNTTRVAKTNPIHALRYE